MTKPETAVARDVSTATTDLHIRWASVARSRWLIALSFLIGALLACVLFAYAPRKWDALATVRVGNVGLNTPIESTSTCVIRMQSVTFIRAALAAAHHPELLAEFLPRKLGGQGQLDIRELHGTDMIELRFRAAAPALARQLASAWVEEIARLHAAEAERMNAPLRERLAELQGKLAALEHQDAGSAQADAQPSTGALPSTGGVAEARTRPPATVDAAANTSLQSQILGYAYADLIERTDEQLAARQYQATESIEPVYVNPEPSSPRPLFYVALGLLLGLALCIPTLLLRKAVTFTRVA